MKPTTLKITTRPHLATLAIAASVALAAACGANGTVTQVGSGGSDGSTGSPSGAQSIAASQVRDALGTAEDLTSGRMEIVMNFSGPESGGMYTTVEFNGADSYSSMNYEGSMFDAAAAEGFGAMFDGPTETIVVDNTSYTKGAMNAFFGADPDTWVTFGPMDEALSDLGIDNGDFSDELGGMMGEGSSGDISQYGSLLGEMLDGVEQNFEKVGSDEVRGETFDHYRMVLDAEDFAAIEDATGVDGADAMGEATFDVWLDAFGLARKVSITGGEGDTAVDISMELYDVGADIEITAPENAETINPADMFGGFVDAFGEGVN